jgi:hypothetical protein
VTAADERRAAPLASVLRTIHQRNLEADVILSQLLRSRQPTIALVPPPGCQ